MTKTLLDILFRLPALLLLTCPLLLEHRVVIACLSWHDNANSSWISIWILNETLRVYALRTKNWLVVILVLIVMTSQARSHGMRIIVTLHCTREKAFIFLNSTRFLIASLSVILWEIVILLFNHSPIFLIVFVVKITYYCGLTVVPLAAYRRSS